MRKNLIIMLAAVAVVLGCTSRKEEFKAADGSVCAVHDERSDSWTIMGPDGREVVTGYDSMRVAEVSEDGHPMTVIYYTGNRQTVLQYFSSMALRCRGELVDGLREGLWQFYYENGNLQSEATFVAGRESGEKRVFRENGVPYYIGHYDNGVRVGTWEAYDPDGGLVEKREYGDD